VTQKTQSVVPVHVRGAAKYSLWPGKGSAAHPKVVAERYRAGQAQLNAYQQVVKTALTLDHVPQGVMAVCLRLSAQLYRIQRRAYGDELLRMFVEPLATAVRRGLDVDRVMFIAHAARNAFGPGLPDDEQAELRGMVERLLTEWKEKQTVETVTQEDTSQLEETGIVALVPADPLASLKPREVNALVRELRAQAQKLLAEKVGPDAHMALEALLERAGTGNGKGRTKRAKAASGLSYDRVMSLTAHEKSKLKKAESDLNQALMLHEPIVRQVVALRLCKRMPTEDIAAEVQVDVRDVEEILARMRPWVARLTTFFDSDWFWGPATATA